MLNHCELRGLDALRELRTLKTGRLPFLMDSLVPAVQDQQEARESERQQGEKGERQRFTVLVIDLEAMVISCLP